MIAKKLRLKMKSESGDNVQTQVAKIKQNIQKMDFWHKELSCYFVSRVLQ